MFTTFHRCSEHKTPYPDGRMCPQCETEQKDRQKAALVPNWDNIIPLKRRLEFIKTEAIYCRDEERAFLDYNNYDVNTKEKLRTTVLEKRQEFLELFLRVLEDERKGEQECLLTQK